MAAATLTQTSWGVRATTGTDATAITTNTVKLWGILFQGTAGAETVTVADKNGVQLIKIVTTTANAEYMVEFGGLFIDGLTVTLSASTVSANFFFN